MCFFADKMRIAIRSFGQVHQISSQAGPDARASQAVAAAKFHSSSDALIRTGRDITCGQNARLPSSGCCASSKSWGISWETERDSRLVVCSILRIEPAVQTSYSSCAGCVIKSRPREAYKMFIQPTAVTAPASRPNILCLTKSNCLYVKQPFDCPWLILRIKNIAMTTLCFILPFFKIYITRAEILIETDHV
jgi:hypothetical protein